MRQPFVVTWTAKAVEALCQPPDDRSLTQGPYSHAQRYCCKLSCGCVGNTLENSVFYEQPELLPGIRLGNAQEKAVATLDDDRVLACAQFDGDTVIARVPSTRLDRKSFAI